MASLEASGKRVIRNCWRSATAKALPYETSKLYAKPCCLDISRKGQRGHRNTASQLSAHGRVIYSLQRGRGLYFTLHADSVINVSYYCCPKELPKSLLVTVRSCCCRHPDTLALGQTPSVQVDPAHQYEGTVCQYDSPVFFCSHFHYTTDSQHLTLYGNQHVCTTGADDPARLHQQAELQQAKLQQAQQQQIQGPEPQRLTQQMRLWKIKTITVKTM